LLPRNLLPRNFLLRCLGLQRRQTIGFLLPLQRLRDVLFALQGCSSFFLQSLWGAGCRCGIDRRRGQWRYLRT